MFQRQLIDRGRSDQFMKTATPVPSATDSPTQPVSSSDTAEFEVLFQGEQRRLFGVAFSILRDPSEAEDALQDVAAQAWKNWGSRSTPERTRAWLTTICVRHCVRQRSRVMRRLFMSDAERGELAAATDYLRYDGRYIDLDRAYSSLSRRQRAVLTLHYQFGYSLSECAALMGCSLGTAGSHLARALAKLRQELGND